jgi:hypothetical protein
MAKPHEVDSQLVLDFFEDPNTQSGAVHYISFIRAYDKDKKKNVDLLIEANEIAVNMSPKMPYDEVMLDGVSTKSANDMMLVTCLYLSELGLIPSYEK